MDNSTRILLGIKDPNLQPDPKFPEMVTEGIHQGEIFTDGTPFEYSRNRHRYDHGGIVVYHPERPTP
ncbi:hypothetical protein LFYK43_19140 [Ligilactobacillus salitolerans]|uniref:Uncharacterized protein n=1 Tax=Ligilactobacillus salitolerans TaxID=1808352 RepID=A0A401IVB8_9LACO|nr:hypothetical protein [Ligilactobacillus salitolerans]GBG95455.1 hypothetical protein LFYK43_19140 [Ligilactobacillus salitolerans]